MKKEDIDKAIKSLFEGTRAMNNEKEIEVYSDNGQYSHSEIIDTNTGEFRSYVCPICGARWKDKESDKHRCC